MYSSRVSPRRANSAAILVIKGTKKTSSNNCQRVRKREKENRQISILMDALTVESIIECV